MGQGMSKRRISAAVVVAGACAVLMTVSLVTPVTPPAHADSSAPYASDSVASVDRHTVSADRSPDMRERDPHGNPLPAAHRPDVKYPRGGQGSAQVPSDPHTVTKVAGTAVSVTAPHTKRAQPRSQGSQRPVAAPSVSMTVLPDADARKLGGHGVALRFNGDAAQNWASASCGEDS